MESNPDISGETSVVMDSGHGGFAFDWFDPDSGVHKTVNWDIITTAEYQKGLELKRKLAKWNQPPFAINYESKESRTCKTMSELVNAIISIAKSGASLQRYKGLGEMNPEQLWETTMNPDTRTLLQIHIDDAVEASDIFTLLMGEKVEPRRDFISRHALEVKNLDV